jgi:hypothetical protein
VPNTIAGNAVIANAADGIFMSRGDGATLSANAFVGNGGLAIDLLGGSGESFGVTPNDQDDADTGPNGLQNFPVIGAAHRASNGVTTITASLNSLHSAQFTIEFYVVVADPHGHGEGFRFLGKKTVLTNTGGDASFSFATVNVAAGELVSATATDANGGSTSEFSANVPVS